MTSTSTRWKFAGVAIVAIAMGILLAMHAPFMNGPAYWKWPWRRIAAWPYFGAMLLCAAPIFAAMFIGAASRARRVAAIGLIMLSMFAMQVVQIGMTVKPFSLSRIVYFVESPMNTSYFADALRSMDHPAMELLSNYPGYMPQFYMHGQEKPPGPVLFFRTIIAIAGQANVDHTALLAGLVIGVLATLVVPATYLMVHAILKDQGAALLACAMIAMCPGEILNFPVLDQVYAVGTCLMVVAWILALRTAKPQAAMGFGFVLAMCLFVVYHFLVLGALLAAMTVGIGVSSKRSGMIKSVGVALGTMVVLYFAFYVVTGFNPVRTFQTALVEQHQHLSAMDRPYPKTILFDLTDFVLGAAWIPVALAMMAILNSRMERTTRRWSVLCVGQIVLLALTGLMQAETARIWCFLLPLLMLAAATELSRWPRWMRVAVLAMIWLLLCLVGQNMAFMF